MTETHLTSTEIEKLMMEQVGPLDYEIVAEHGGWSLYDRKSKPGYQCLMFTSDICQLWEAIFHECKLSRRPA